MAPMKRGTVPMFALVARANGQTGGQTQSIMIQGGAGTLAPQELVGFNTGTFSKVQRSGTAGSLAFALFADTDLLIHIEKVDGATKKTLVTVAELVHKAFIAHGIPQIGLEGHVLKPAQGTNGTTPYFRFNVIPNVEAHVFKPDDIPATDAKMKDGGHMKLKHGEIGALLDAASCTTLLSQGGPVAVLWEVEVDTNPPATIRLLKPKLWLLRPVACEAEKAYVLWP